MSRHVERRFDVRGEHPIERVAYVHALDRRNGREEFANQRARTIDGQRFVVPAKLMSKDDWGTELQVDWVEMSAL